MCECVVWASVLDSGGGEWKACAVGEVMARAVSRSCGCQQGMGRDTHLDVWMTGTGR